MTPEREADLRQMADLLIRHGGDEQGQRLGGFIEEVFAALDSERAASLNRRVERALVQRAGYGRVYALDTVTSPERRRETKEALEAGHVDAMRRAGR